MNSNRTQSETDSHNFTETSTRTEPETPVRVPLRLCLSVFLLGTLIAALYALVLYPRQSFIQPTIDLNGFGRMGRHLAEGQGFSIGDGPTVRRAPLYPLLVAGLLKLSGYQPAMTDAVAYRPVIIVNCLFVGLACLVASTLAWKLFNARTAWVAGILCAVMPTVWRYAPMTEVETVMGLLIALIALTGLNLYRTPSLANGLLFGVVTAAATLTKPIPLLFPLVFLPLCWRNWRRNRPDTIPPKQPSLWQPALAALAVFFLCLLPWIVRNHIVTNGRFKNISSNAPGEFIRGYVNAQPKYYLLRVDFGGKGDENGMIWDWEANLYEEALLQKYGSSFFSTTRIGPNGERYSKEATIDNELEKDAIETREIKRRLVQEPLQFLHKFFVQIFMFWYLVDTRKKSVLMGLLALAALSLAAFGWIRARRNGIDPTPLVAVILYFNLMYAALLAFARYAMPLFPTLLPLTAYGVTQLFARRQSSDQ